MPLIKLTQLQIKIRSTKLRNKKIKELKRGVFFWLVGDKGFRKLDDKQIRRSENNGI